MPERPRLLAVRSTSRAWLVCAVCVAVVLIFAAGVLLFVGGRGHAPGHVSEPPPVVLAPMPLPASGTGSAGSPVPMTSSTLSRSRRRVAAQDPQDRPGSRAARRAARALASHRALQHVPYHHDRVTIKLTGALRGGRAVLSVTAPTLRAARAGYRRFLARFHDSGRGYQPRFHATARRRRHG